MDPGSRSSAAGRRPEPLARLAGTTPGESQRRPVAEKFRLYLKALTTRGEGGRSVQLNSLLLKIISIAPAKPSSSFDFVTRVATFLTSSVALPMAIDRPLFLNIAR